MLDQKSDLAVQVETSSGVTGIKISGAIDEHINFSSIEIPSGTALTIDLELVTRLNSMGLRTWLKWSSGLGQCKSLVLKNCPRGFIDQFNLLEAFLPAMAVIESFYIPYICEECDIDVQVLAIRGKDFMESSSDRTESILLKEQITCKSCDRPMVRDILEAKYFAFLKQKR